MCDEQSVVNMSQKIGDIIKTTEKSDNIDKKERRKKEKRKEKKNVLVR